MLGFASGMYGFIRLMGNTLTLELAEETFEGCVIATMQGLVRNPSRPL